jgi:quercetin 2,3-dioxygenase
MALGGSSSSPSIKFIPNDKLYVSEPDPRYFGNGPNPKSDASWTNQNWLKSRFHFSFAEYSSYKNSDFGVLRVMNDDLVQPHRGFGTHPHGDMEIITYIVHGELTHKDSMGTSESLGRGSIQFMTAGSGIRHSEFNEGDKPLRFIQTWIVPSQRGLKPNYGSYNAQHELKKNQLQHLVSNVKDPTTSTPVEINQDVNAFASELELGQKVSLDLPPARQAYLLCIEGSVKVNGQVLNKYDACEITNSPGVVDIEATGVEATENGDLAHILAFTMAAVPGSGRTDI